MIRSLLLFTHIAGMLLLFAGLALELARIELRRIYGFAFGLILLSGIYLAAREGMHTFAWVRVSFIAMLLMAIAGIAPIRSRLPILSLRVRIALGIGIVFLMISKLAAAGSILVIGLALLAGIAASFFRPHPAAAADAPLSSGGPVW